ncbi:hypothetical protein N0V82_006609 [Gnomoniopsis sp. IMI 355080]|nr:hypothetical protein N0V82_006609 [Gnomoniopsis sp. IMI 355080]
MFDSTIEESHSRGPHGVVLHLTFRLSDLMELGMVLTTVLLLVTLLVFLNYSKATAQNIPQHTPHVCTVCARQCEDSSGDITTATRDTGAHTRGATTPEKHTVFQQSDHPKTRSHQRQETVKTDNSNPRPAESPAEPELSSPSTWAALRDELEEIRRLSKLVSQLTSQRYGDSH